MLRDVKIPKALSNDNFIGYVAAFFVEKRVTWLEATIAAPVFSGLVCYYVEGKPGEKHHMMESALGQPERAYGVRGNIFSFLLPWEKVMAELCKKIEDGNLNEWPLDRRVLTQICKVRFVHGPEKLLDKFKELRVRAWVIRKLAYLYIERHIADLGERPGVLKIHAFMRQATVEDSLKRHADARIATSYPAEEYDTEHGAVPSELREMQRLRILQVSETVLIRVLT